MIKLLRASAGSGKTYRLTLEFITLLLTIPLRPGTQKRRLRTPTELQEPLSHILAITFTNKATNEMKERIVGKLAELADTDIPDPDYLSDLTAITGADDCEVRRAAAIALRHLLNNYSDFKVSTIDSFFQTVLRTFTYEANLTDGYNVELDSDYVAQVGVDSTLTQVNTKADKETVYWIERLMTDKLNRGEKGWNPFQKNAGAHTIYGQIYGHTKKMQSEQYKRHKHEIDAYWDRTPSFRHVYDTVEAAVSNLLSNEFQALKEAARRVSDYLENAPDELRLCISYPNRIDAALAMHQLDPIPFKYGTELKKVLESRQTGEEGFVLKGGQNQRKKILADPAKSELNSLMFLFYHTVADYDEKYATPGVAEWIVYRETLVYYSLMQKVRRASSDFLLENNIIELAETNTLLGRVIGDDEAPFIYERLGSYIRHYLIDEFQDTSRMQWDNLVPLLRESESNANDNLIIGDAKQSIYRFRNADPTLITIGVSDEFDILPGGNSLKDNTNYRSRPGIVTFNNSFFRTLADIVDQRRNARGLPIATDPDQVKKLYSNTVQPYKPLSPGDDPDEGYVEIRFVEKAKSKSQVADEDTIPDESYYTQIPEIIADLMARGYRQGDIAVLARTKEQLQSAINSCIAYNEEHAQSDTQINFVSEESLRIADSDAVKRVLAALRMIARGQDNPTPDGDGNHFLMKNADVADLACAFNFRTLGCKEDELSAQLEKFLNDANPGDDLRQFLNEIHSAALPSLTEAIIGRYVKPSQSDGQAPYLSAFQDCVTDYCTVHPADPASFLNWWDQKGKSLSISSPKGTDAVEFMTIHKSKGLQKRCVIIPDASMSIIRNKLSDWLWLPPADTLPEFSLLPPYIPVKAEKGFNQLLGTAHAAELIEAQEAEITDNINLVYVGFTRAIDELYIFAPQSSASKNTGSTLALGDVIRQVCDDFDNTYHHATEELKPWLKSPDAPRTGDNSMITFGAKPLQARILKKETPKAQAIHSDQYNVYFDPDRLKFEESGGRPPSDDDPDPRSRGNLMHEILALAAYPSQIPAAAKALRNAGRINRRQEQEYTEYLVKKTESPQVRHWFADDIKVYNERAILLKDSSLKRPDRIAVKTDSGHAFVIDYKFGVPEPKHRKQVGQYCNLLQRTGLFASISGHIWYVDRDEIIDLQD